MIKFKFKIKNILLMMPELTDYLLRLTFQNAHSLNTLPYSFAQPSSFISSQDILQNIYSILNSEKNYKTPGQHKSSYFSQQSTSQSPMKCNCKKSKCLKLYCECFSKGSFCKDCNCECCYNKEQFIQIRAKAIDEMVVKTTVPFGYRTHAMKGCNCRKTGCQKKYCECYNQGMGCSQYCKCVNCENVGCP